MGVLDHFIIFFVCMGGECLSDAEGRPRAKIRKYDERAAHLRSVDLFQTQIYKSSSSPGSLSSESRNKPVVLPYHTSWASLACTRISTLQ